MYHRKRKNKVNINEVIDTKMTSVVEDILAQLAAGTAPWVRPWSSLGPLRNIATGTVYKGRNILPLTSTIFGDPRWITFRDIKAKGGSLQKGSKSSFVVKAISKSYIENPKASEADQTKVSYFSLKYFNVFNVEQVSGIEFPEIVPLQDHERQAPIDLFIDSLSDQLDLRHGGDRAFFAPSENFVTLPELGHFNNPQLYYSTLFHELIHWTGHSSRLKRVFGSSMCTPVYSFEELVAELGASFLCAHFQVDGMLSHSGSYIDSWIKRLSKDPRGTLLEASTLASEAVHFLLGDSFSSHLEPGKSL